MKNWIFSLLIITSLKAHAQVAEPDKKLFSESLGETEWQALNELLTSFDLFLEENYPNQSLEDQTRLFLKAFDDDSPTKWSFTNPNIYRAFQQAESSGLRKEMYFIGDDGASYITSDTVHVNRLPYFEDDFEDIIDIPSFEPLSEEEQLRISEEEQALEEMRKMSLTTNRFGSFLSSFLLIKGSDPLIDEYIMTKNEVGDLSPYLVAFGMLKMKKQSSVSWGMRLIIVYELYYPILHWHFYIQR